MSVYIYKLSQWIEKRFNAKGGNVITDFEQSARAVLPLSIGVEERYLQGWNRFAAFSSIAAVAAAFGRFRIRNPVGSNVIAVVEAINYFTLAAVTDSPFVTWGATTTDLTNLVSLSFARMDPRGNPQPTIIISQVAQASGGLPFIERTAIQNANVDFINSIDQQIPVLPGQVVDVQSQVANTVVAAGCIWRERALELSELT